VTTAARLGRATRAAGISDEAVGIVGSGAFATALASILSSRDKTAVLYTSDKDVRRDINRNHRNESRLPGVSLAKRVAATGDLEELADLCSLIILSVPSHRASSAIEGLARVVTAGHTLAHAIGGLADHDKRVSQLIESGTAAVRIAALAGPALPRDLSARRSCAMVVASDRDDVLDAIKATLHTPPTLRLYKSDDLLGVELAAALSGAMTIAVGLADGLNIGHGPRTVLLTRAASEAARLCAANGARERTFFGMAGLGNLLVRTSPESREFSKDYQLGFDLARGNATSADQTEGARSLATAARLAKVLDVPAPICHMTHQVVTGAISPEVCADKLASWETDLE
jgi:glycerol-3-phosphate dehydrogenase (NAD(P)+)